MAQKMTVEALDLWYGSHQALHDVTIEMPAGEVTAALGPRHEREPAHAQAVQPWPHVARGEVDEAPRPRVAVPVGTFPALRTGGELRGAEPVVERELGGVLHPEAALLGGVDEEQPAERPEGLPAERGARLCVEERDARAARAGAGLSAASPRRS